MSGRAMVHGRFQPFHLGHLELLREAVARGREVWVGITNPDPSHRRAETADPLRHLPEANPWSYAERLLMVEAAAADLGLAHVRVVPFPLDEPELLAAYVPAGAVHYLRVFDAWGDAKVERLRAAGYEAVVVGEGAAKEVTGTQVRAALAAGRGWEELVPPGVARVLRELGAA